MGKKVVIALGGNALQKQGEEPSYENQKKNVEVAVDNIIKLIEDDYDVIITHGNGPQIGRLLIQNEVADSEETPAIPFDGVSALSQGSIGYQIMQVLGNKLKKANLNKSAVTLLTQVEVSADDPGFNNPTKPIGPYYTKEEAETIAQEKDYVIKEDSNRGYRRVVASPQPIDVLEKDQINLLTSNNTVVVCCGGGGIPVIRQGEEFIGVPAVIDKDKASSLLAEQIGADYLVILTAVKEVALNYGKSNEVHLNKVTVDELARYAKENQFAPGSMLPKVESVMDFVTKTKKTAVITTLENAYTAITTSSSGTIVK